MHRTEGKSRAETAKIAEQWWREWVRESFTARDQLMGRKRGGSQTECSRALGLAQGHLSRLLSGRTGSSDRIDDITDWVLRHCEGATLPFLARLDAAARVLWDRRDEEGLRQLVELAERFVDSARREMH